MVEVRRVSKRVVEGGQKGGGGRVSKRVVEGGCPKGWWEEARRGEALWREGRGKAERGRGRDSCGPARAFS